VGLHQCPSERKGRAQPGRGESVPSHVLSMRRLARRGGIFHLQPWCSLEIRTHCWREPNSNHRSRSCELGPAPRPRYARDMCGRARLSSDVSEIKLVFRVPPERPAPNFPPSWNVASTDTLPAVRYDARASERTLDVMRWGLKPFGRRTSKSDSRISTPKPRGSRASPPSARHFSGAASFRWTISMPTRRSSKPCSRPTRRRRWSPGPSARGSATSRTMTRA
jgi:hypothetical protein